MADQTVGSLVVKLLFESNALKVFGEIITLSKLADEALTQTGFSGKGVTVSLSPQNEELGTFIRMAQESREAVESLRSQLTAAGASQETLATSTAKVDEKAKEFTVTINRQGEELEQETRPLREATIANDVHREAIERVKHESQEQATQLSATGAAAKESAQKIASAGKEQLGTVEQLKIDMMDLKRTVELATNPADVARLNAELKQTQRALNEIQGKGMKNVRQDFNDTAFQINRTHQVLFALSFLMNSFSSENASKEQRKWQQALTNGTSTALGTSFALQTLGTRFAGLAGPVGLALGAITSIVALLKSTDEEAREAAEDGLKLFVNRLAGASGTDLKFLRTALAEMKEVNVEAKKFGELTASISFGASTDQLKKSLQDLKGISPVGPLQVALPMQTAPGDVTAAGARQAVLASVKTENAERAKTVEELEKEISRQEVLNEFQEKANKIIREHGSQLQIIRVDMEEIGKRIQTENLSHEERRKLVDQLATKQREQAQLLKSSDQIIQESLRKEQQRVELGTSTLDNLERLLVKAKAEIQDREKVLDIEQQIRAVHEQKLALMQRQQTLGDISLQDLRRALAAELAVEKSEERRLALRQQIKDLDRQEREGVETLQQLRIQTITDSSERRKQEIDLEIFRTEQAFRVGEIKETQKDLQIRALQSERHRLEVDQANDIKRLNIDSIRDEERRIIARYALELEIVNQQTDEKALKEAALAMLRLRQEAELGELRISYEKELEILKRSDLDAQEKERQIQALEASRDRQISAINERYDTEQQKISSTSNLTDLRAARTAQLIMQRQREIDDLRQQGMDTTLAQVQLLGEALKGVLGESAGKFIDDMLAALQIVMQIVDTVQKMQSGATSGPMGILSIFTGILGLGKIILGRAEGGEIPSGSYVVNEQMSERYRPLLDALGAKEVTGGVPHQDSVLARSGDQAVALTPKERILPPHLAPVGEILNRGLLAQGHLPRLLEILSSEQFGGASRSDFFSVLMRVVEEGPGAPGMPPWTEDSENPVPREMERIRRRYTSDLAIGEDGRLMFQEPLIPARLIWLDALMRRSASGDGVQPFADGGSLPGRAFSSQSHPVFELSLPMRQSSPRERDRIETSLILEKELQQAVSSYYRQPTVPEVSPRSISIVLEAAGADRVDLRPVISELQKLRAETEELRRETGTVRSAVQSIKVDFPDEIRARVDVDNMQMRLRREWRALDKFNRRKRVS